MKHDDTEKWQLFRRELAEFRREFKELKKDMERVRRKLEPQDFSQVSDEDIPF